MAETNPDNTVVEPVTPTPEELARKVAEQDRDILKPGDFDTTDSMTALDALAEAKTKQNADDAAAQDEAAAKAKAEEEAAAKLGKSPVAPVPDPGKAAPAAGAPKASATDPFPDEQLPAGSRGKSAEAFAKVKLLAAQEIEKLSAKSVELEKKLKEHEEKAKNPLPADLENEIKELRDFKARLDIEADPKWKEFGQRADNTSEFIYAQLKKHGSVVDNDTIEQIKKLGGPLGVNMQKILDAINDPTTTHLVQSKMADLAQLKFDKDNAIQAAKTNAAAYVQSREKEFEQAVAQHTQLTKQAYSEISKKMEWLLPRQAKPEATEDDKKAIGDHNKWVEDTNKELAIASQDDSPQMRAILLAGMAQLFYLQKEHGQLKASSTKAVADLEAKLKTATDTLEAKLKTATDTLDRFKRSSTTRIRDVVPPGAVPAAKDSVNPNMTASESLDALAKRIIEARNAAPSQ